MVIVGCEDEDLSGGGGLGRLEQELERRLPIKQTEVSKKKVRVSSNSYAIRRKM